jgi:hypothetical protein
VQIEAAQMVLTDVDEAGADRVTVWQCIGCGKIEGPQPCIGVCQDRKVDFVYAAVHDETLARMERMHREAKVMERFLRRLVHTMPRDGEWERSYRALQEEARRTLAALAADEIKPARDPR